MKKKIILSISLFLFMGVMAFNLQQASSQHDTESAVISMSDLKLQLASAQADDGMEGCVQFCNHGSAGYCRVSEGGAVGFKCWYTNYDRDCYGTWLRCFD